MIRGDMKIRICGLLLLLSLARSQKISLGRPTIFEQMLASVRNIEMMVRDTSLTLSTILEDTKPSGASKWSNPYVLLDLERVESPPSFLNPVVSRRAFGMHEPGADTGPYFSDYVELNDYADQMSSEERKLFEPVPHVITLRRKKPQIDRPHMTLEDDSSNINTNVNTNVNDNGNLIDRTLRPKYKKRAYP